MYKERYKEEKDNLNKHGMNKFGYKKVKLTDDYDYESEKEKKQTNKKADKK